MVSVSTKFTIRDIRLSQNDMCNDVLVFTGKAGRLAGTSPCCNESYVRGGNSACNGTFALISTSVDKLLKVFDLDTWDCVSHCHMEFYSLCLYESVGVMYVHCNDLGIYRVTVTPTLAITKCGETERCYHQITTIGSNGNLLAISGMPMDIHVIAPSGQLVGDITTTAAYNFTYPHSLTTDKEQVVIVDDTCFFQSRLVSVTIGGDYGECVSFNCASSEIIGKPRSPVIFKGVVIVPVRYVNTILILDLSSGVKLKQIQPLKDPGINVVTCLHLERLFIACDSGVLAEFHILGK
jgi:hypothetical protein